MQKIHILNISQLFHRLGANKMVRKAVLSETRTTVSIERKHSARFEKDATILICHGVTIIVLMLLCLTCYTNNF